MALPPDLLARVTTLDADALAELRAHIDGILLEEEEGLSDAARADIDRRIDRGLDDLRQGRTIPTEQALARFGAAKPA